MKLTSEEYARLTGKPKKKVVNKRWDKCVFCGGKIVEEATVEVLYPVKFEGRHHAKCIRKD